MPPRFPAGGLPALEAQIDVAADVPTVWRIVSDLRSMGERSPETVRMVITDTPQVGSRGVNLNRRGAVVWPTTTRITRWKPPAHDGSASLAFRVGPSGLEWSYDLTPTGDGTHVVERRSVYATQDPASSIMSRWLLGGAENHDAEILAGMHATLRTVKALAERA